MGAVKLSEASKNLLKNLILEYNVNEGKEITTIKDNGAILYGQKPGFCSSKPQEEVDFIDIIKDVTGKISATKNGRAEHFYVCQMIKKIFDSFIKLDKNEIIRKIYITHLTNECPMVTVSYEGRSYEIAMDSPMSAEIKLPQRGNDGKQNNQGGDKGNNQNNNQNQGNKNNHGGDNKNNNQNNQNNNNQGGNKDNQGDGKKKEEQVVVLQGSTEEIAEAMTYLANKGQAVVVTPKKNN